MIGQRDILFFIAAVFKKQSIPYLLTGSFAVSYYGRPRATHDIDFILEINTKDADKFLLVIDSFGDKFSYDLREIKSAIEKKLQWNIIHLESGIKLDFWLVGNNEFEISKFNRKSEIVLDGKNVSIVSAEDLILTKLQWSKEVRSERHIRDCIGIWEIQKEQLDAEYLKIWAKKLRVENLLKEVKHSTY